MILNALCEYYDLLSEVEDSEISPYGFQKVKANYAAVLSEDGLLQDIISLNQLNNNRPQTFTTPTSMKSSAIAASPVCDNFEYVFGIAGEKGEKNISSNKFQAAKKLHIDLFKDAESTEASAIRMFFEKWDPNHAWENENILKHYSEKGKSFPGNIVFRLAGKVEYFHQNEEIKRLWLMYNDESKKLEKNIIGQCAVTGEIGPISRIHNKLQGIDGASTMGASLVSFKKDSFQSYGLEQSRNSSVSEQVVFKYGTVLQQMLSNNEQRIVLGDATTVFWASKAEQTYVNVFKCILSNPDLTQEENVVEDIKTREIVKTILQSGKSGVYNNVNLDPNMKFNILGLSPNAGRASVRFFYQNTFFDFCSKIKMHYEDIKIYAGEKGKENIKVSSLLYATISSKSRDKKINPLLSGSVVRAILTGEMYPQILFTQTIMRVKAEKDVTQPRAAIIKGYLVRKNRFMKKEDELSMYLNEKSTNPAYVLGRTFAVLEMIQKKALGEELNVTIKDKYFASACSNPSLVFPNLLKLTQHHLAKIEGSYWNKKLGDCLGLIEGESFPKILSMENQGRFILGYYQQTQKNYEKKQVNKEDNNDGNN